MTGTPLYDFLRYGLEDGKAGAQVYFDLLRDRVSLAGGYIFWVTGLILLEAGVFPSSLLGGSTGQADLERVVENGGAGRAQQTGWQKAKKKNASRQKREPAGRGDDNKTMLAHTTHSSLLVEKVFPSYG